jgi:dedicator of cytokinesis protein 3
MGLDGADSIAADVLPGLLSRSEVVDILYEEISPLSSAIAEIGRGTGQLHSLISFKPGQKLE